MPVGSNVSHLKASFGSEAPAFARHASEVKLQHWDKREGFIREARPLSRHLFENQNYPTTDIS